MQYVNDDMDEMFRRAAEDYPLDTSGADWEKVKAMLNGDAASSVTKEKKKRRFFWFFLIIPVGMSAIAYFYYQPATITTTKPVAARNIGEKAPATKETSNKESTENTVDSSDY
jgi:hypothetical protein